MAIFIAAGPANLPGKFEDAESNEATSYLPGDAESTTALDATESLQNGEIAPAVIVYRRDSGLTAADRQTIDEDVGKMTAKRFPGVDPRRRHRGRRGQAAPARSEPTERPRGRPARLRQPDQRRPRPARRLRALRRPDLLAGRQGGDRHRLHQGQGEGERILDPVKYWRDEISDPGGGLEVKITGGAGFSADAIEVFEGINGTLLLAALSLVIFLLIVIYRSPMFFLIPLAR